MNKIKLYQVPAAMEIEVPRGMIFSGKVVRDTAGALLPVFEPAPPPPGKLSINTREGWNAMCRENRRRRARLRLGHEPTDADIDEQQQIDRRIIDAATGAKMEV